jgi:kynurenine formamidase
MCLPPAPDGGMATSCAASPTASPPAAAGQGAETGPDTGLAVQDLTRVFIAGFPTVVPGVELSASFLETDYHDHGFRGQRWSLYEHTGTHVDAPVHFVPGQIDVTQIAAEDLARPLVIIDISERCRADPDTLLDQQDLELHEARHGRIPTRAALVLRTGWDRIDSRDPVYLNLIDGAFHTPGFSAGAVSWLLEHRDVACLGTDTSSIDAGNAADAPAHRLLLAAGRYAVEGLTNLHLVPSGSTLIAAVVPWENGTGGPCRALALYRR